MPVYDYKCLDCGTVFEYKQSMSEDALTVCPPGKCNCGNGGSPVQRVMSKNIGLVFKGSGFYVTDYASKNKSSSESKPSDAASSCSTGGCGCNPGKDVA
ncbi:MAG: FmdB family zinc ribbon protein [Candidatus Kapaibacterium sp.]|jgi:putative FmdB family regulatory protein|nr:zinc ribbon domain-containing protein [Candidatus Kapabacteria bacterium]